MYLLYFKTNLSIKSSLDREYPFICLFLTYKGFWIYILYNSSLLLVSKYICIILWSIRIYPCLYFLGKYKAHSLYRCVGSCMSLAFNRSNSSFCISGNNTLLVILVSLSICSGNMSLANIVCIASCTVFLIVSTFRSLVAQNLLRGHRWWSLYSLSFFITKHSHKIKSWLLPRSILTI